MGNEVTKQEQGEVVVQTQEQAFLSLLERAAKDPAVDVGKMSALLDMQERVLNKKAEALFNQAYSAAKMEMPRIAKTGAVSYNDQKAFSFAKYEDLDKAIRPIERAHGFSRIFTTEERQGGGVIVHCTLLHREGHGKKASIPVALDTSGGKNNIQAMGSSFSYGKRYTTTMLWDIVTEGEDNDGNFDVFPIDDAQFEEIQRLIDESQTDTAAFCKHMKVESLKAITQKQYGKATNDLKAKIETLKKKGKK